MTALQDRILTHMNGTGNSFFILNALSESLNATTAERAAFARKICGGVNGVIADGLVILEKTEAAHRAKADFAWDFYNSDGSFAEMCGNASRCVSRFFLEKVSAQPEVNFLTAAGVITGDKVSAETYRVKMPVINEGGRFLPLSDSDDSQTSYFFINTGVPHLIVEAAPDKAVALKLRVAPALQPAGSNVTFFEELSISSAKAVTFERGVDDFTLACGTGAVAAAAYAKTKNPGHKKFVIQMPGGPLEVEWLSEMQTTLTGPAQFDFEGRFL